MSLQFKLWPWKQIPWARDKETKQENQQGFAAFAGARYPSSSCNSGAWRQYNTERNMNIFSSNRRQDIIKST